MLDVVCALASVALLCCSMVARPTSARCMGRFYVNGIRPTGVYECRPVAGGSPMLDGTWGTPDGAIDRPGWYRGRIWCTSGAHPIVVLATRDSEARVVGCQR